MKGSQIHFWAKMGLGKFGWGKNGTGQIWVGANLALGKFGFRANLAGQTWSGQTWPGKLGLGKNGLTPKRGLRQHYVSKAKQKTFNLTWKRPGVELWLTREIIMEI